MKTVLYPRDCFTGDRLSTSSLLESHKECLAVETQAVDSFLTESPLHLAISQVHLSHDM